MVAWVTRRKRLCFLAAQHREAVIKTRQFPRPAQMPTVFPFARPVVWMRGEVMWQQTARFSGCN